jgi:pimeloyl-ACP methyl ester carboxylesterase
MQKTILLLMSCLAVFMACSNPERKSSVEHRPETAINLSDSLRGKTSELFLTYSPVQLYLPSGWESDKNVLMFLFDPAGAPSTPLNLYRNLAHQKNIALACAPGIRNQTPLESSVSLAANLLDSLIYVLKPASIYLAGFSGGSKVAMLLAERRTDVSRIIYSGSGISLSSPNNHTSWIGIIGQRDMNYTEMINLHLGMQAEGMNAMLLEWPGGHEWPAEKYMEWALISDLNDLPEKRLFTNSEKKKELRDKEEQLKSYYLKALGTQPSSWWINEMKILRERAAFDREGVYERLKGFISLACYSLGNRAVREYNTAAAGPIIEVYGIADPENPDADILRARYLLLLGKPDAAKEALKSAGIKGYNKFNELDPELRALFNP